MRTLQIMIIALVAGIPLTSTPCLASHPPLFHLKWGGPGSAVGSFNLPRAMAVDPDGNLFVVDDQNHRIQKFAPDGTFLMSWGSFGTGNGQFRRPFGIAIGPSGDLYVSELDGDRIQRFTGSGVFVLKWGSLGAGNGQFNEPLHIACDAAGDVYVADRNNHRIQKFNASGAYITKWGTFGTGNGQFNTPIGVTVDASGSVYVTEFANHRVQKFTNTGGFIRRWGSLGSGNGQFNSPRGIVATGVRSGASPRSGGVVIYVADGLNHRVQAFTEIGVFLHRWGSNGSADGQFSTTEYCVVGPDSSLYVSDLGNHRVQRFAPPPIAAGPCISVDVYATLNDAPVGIDFDAADNLFIGNADIVGGSGGPAQITRVSGVDQSIQIFGGSIQDPDAVVVDQGGYLGTPGSVLVGGNTGSTGTITRIGPTGTPTTALVSSSHIFNPFLMEFDSTGRLYVASFAGPGGTSPLQISYVVGTTVTNLLTIPAALTGFAIDGNDNLYITWDGVTRQYSRSGTLLDNAFVAGQAFTYYPSGPFKGLIIVRSGQVIAVDTATKEERVLVTGAFVSDIDFNSSGDMFISEQSHARVLRVHPADQEVPELVLPEDVTVSAAPGDCGIYIPESSLGSAEAHDDCFGVTLSRTGMPGDDYYPIGTTEIVYEATDATGNVATGTQLVTVLPPPTVITGQVTTDCPAAGTPLHGVRIDAYDEHGTLVATAVTDQAGAFAIGDVTAGGTYTVTAVTPLGYELGEEDIPVDLSCGGIVTVDFSMSCISTPGAPRSTGFWKHQVAVATGGPGHAQLDSESLCGFLDLIESHFNGNLINPVVIYEPPSSEECPDKLQVAKTLLNLKGNVGMKPRARQQLMALLLNVAAGYISLHTTISEDSATVSQAITYCDQELDNPLGNHELAKNVAEAVNLQALLPAGAIPLSVPIIAYSKPGSPVQGPIGLAGNAPNPFRTSTEIGFRTASGGRYRVTIFDLAGRRVMEREGVAAPGLVGIPWDGRDESGRVSAPGIYFYRIETAEFTETEKLVRLKP